MDENLQKIEESFNKIPEEVKDYIYSDSFIKAFTEFCQEQRLTSETISLFRGTLYGYIAQVETEETLVNRIRSISTSPEMNQIIINWVKNNVTDKIFDLVIDGYAQNEEVELSEAEASGNNSFTRLNQTMTAPSTLAPTKRSYGENTSLNTTSAPSTAPSGIKSIDPYREIPEK